MPASRIPESCTPISKRRMKMSLLPGTTRYSDPKVVRPNVMSSVTTQMLTRARPATLVRQCQVHAAMPTPTRRVTTGQRPAS